MNNSRFSVEFRVALGHGVAAGVSTGPQVALAALLSACWPSAFHGFRRLSLLSLLGASCLSALASDPVIPDPHLTPGVALPNVTVQQVCQKGYANVLNGGVRNVPESEKRAVFIEYFGAVPAHPGNYEIDHCVSLEIGGSNDQKNLWPEAYTNIINGVDLGAHTKDKLEDRMAALLRDDLKANGPVHATALMHQFQNEIATNWISAYNKYCKPNQKEN